MSQVAFLDTSVLVDAFISEHPDHHRRAGNLLLQLGNGTIVLHISPTVIFETVYVMSRTYRIPRTEIANELTNLLRLDNLVLTDKTLMAKTLDLWAKEAPLSFADCYHLVLAESLGLDAIYAFDRKMGRYPGVARLEP